MSVSGFTEQMLSLTETVSKLLGNIAKIASYISAVYGTFMLWAYLNRASAPFPSVDASLALFLTFYTFVFCVGFLIMSSAILFPIFMKGMMDQSPLLEAFPGLFGFPSLFGSRGKTPPQLKFYPGEYLTLYSPYISLVMSFALAVFYVTHFFYF